MLNSIPVEEWKDGKVQVIEPGIIHLMRGQVYKIDNNKFFTFGGGYLLDKANRTEGMDNLEKMILQ